VLGTEKRVRTLEILSLLGERNRAVYGSWDAGKLKAALEAEGVRTVRVDGIVHVRAANVHERLADRMLDTDGDEQVAE
jgi:3-dehydroquinate dehydratase